MGIILVQCIIIFIGFIASGRNFDGVMSRYYASHMTEDIKVLKNEDQSTEDTDHLMGGRVGGQ